MSDLEVHRKEPCPVNPAWLGSARVAPCGAFSVESLGTWTVEYTVGRYGIDDRGAIILCNHPADDGCEPQFDDPAAPGYVTASTSGDAHLAVRYQTDFWVRPWDRAIHVKVRDGSLAEGDTVRIVLGDTSGGSPGWRLQSFPDRHRVFALLVDAFGTGEFHWLSEEPEIEIVPGPPAGIELVLPSIVPCGRPVTGHVRVCDRCWNPVREPVGQALIDGSESIGGVPLRVELTDGVVPFSTITFTEPGVCRLTVRCGNLCGESNPVEVHPVDAESPQLFWSDMHGQTRETVGTGTVGEYFDFARDRALLDVCGWQGNDFQITDRLWREVCRETAEHNQPGRFVTFLGYEWSGLTPAGGDHNIYFLRDDEQIHRSSHWQIHDGSDASTDRYPIAELWREFAARDDVLAVAHVGGRYANLDTAAGGFPHLVEIHSHHGTFQWLAEDAMRRGMTVGFVAQSDDHTGRPGLSAPLRPVGRGFVTFDTMGGYTGIYADRLTREGIWQALKARHCYATTGRRIVLGFRAADVMMGDCLRWPCGKPLEFAARAHSHGAPIMDLTIQRDEHPAYRCEWPEDADSPWIRVEWSGVRVRSRNKNTDWNGRIAVSGGRIEEFRPYAFDQAGQGVERVGDDALAVRSSTSGDIDGVMIRLGDGAERLTFESEVGTVACDVRRGAPAEPAVFAMGGVNQQVVVSRIDPAVRPRDLDCTWSDTATEAGRHGYWLKLVQADGHIAWSSPIFVDFHR